jgi:catechol 2,3-dioxygenase-like lactoylglutathione lyase family enzyme
VPDLDKALDFYLDVMGWYHIAGPITVIENEHNPLSQISKGIYGNGWKQFRFARLSSADGIGLEIFEFANNDAPQSVNTAFKTGVFHFCVQDPDIEGLIKRIEAAGGEQASPITELAPGKKPYKMVKVLIFDYRIYGLGI